MGIRERCVCLAGESCPRQSTVDGVSEDSVCFSVECRSGRIAQDAGIRMQAADSAKINVLTRTTKCSALYSIFNHRSLFGPCFPALFCTPALSTLFALGGYPASN